MWKKKEDNNNYEYSRNQSHDYTDDNITKKTADFIGQEISMRYRVDKKVVVYR